MPVRLASCTHSPYFGSASVEEIVQMADNYLPKPRKCDLTRNVHDSSTLSSAPPAYWDHFIADRRSLHTHWGNVRGQPWTFSFCGPLRGTKAVLVECCHLFYRWPFLYWPLSHKIQTEALPLVPIIVLYHFAALHHKLHFLESRYILKRIAIDRNDVGPRSRLQAADFAGPAKQIRSVHGCGLDRLQRSQP